MNYYGVHIPEWMQEELHKCYGPQITEQHILMQLLKDYIYRNRPIITKARDMSAEEKALATVIEPSKP